MAVLWDKLHDNNWDKYQLLKSNVIRTYFARNARNWNEDHVKFGMRCQRFKFTEITRQMIVFGGKVDGIESFSALLKKGYIVCVVVNESGIYFFCN